MSNSDAADTAITAAFEKLGCEVSFTRTAVEGLARLARAQRGLHLDAGPDR